MSSNQPGSPPDASPPASGSTPSSPATPAAPPKTKGIGTRLKEALKASTLGEDGKPKKKEDKGDWAKNMNKAMDELSDIVFNINKEVTSFVETTAKDILQAIKDRNAASKAQAQPAQQAASPAATQTGSAAPVQTASSPMPHRTTGSINTQHTAQSAPPSYAEVYPQGAPGASQTPAAQSAPAQPGATPVASQPAAVSVAVVPGATPVASQSAAGSVAEQPDATPAVAQSAAASVDAQPDAAPVVAQHGSPSMLDDVSVKPPAAPAPGERDSHGVLAGPQKLAQQQQSPLVGTSPESQPAASAESQTASVQQSAAPAALSPGRDSDPVPAVRAAVSESPQLADKVASSSSSKPEPDAPEQEKSATVAGP
jgi:hypothetical protein